jgi:ABC-type lipoprotein release transport system permease subunit
MASIAFAVMFAIIMQSLQEGVFNNLIKNLVNYYSGYLQVHQKGYWDEQILDNSFTNDSILLTQLQKNKSVIEIVPRLETFVLASNKNTTKGCLLVGTDTQKENNLTQLKNKLIKGTYFENDEEAILLSEGLAKRLQLEVNDTIVLYGQGYQEVMAAGKYKIKGLLHLASPEMNDSFVYLPLKACQYFLSAEGRYTTIALGIANPNDLEPLKKELSHSISKEYEVMTWQELMPDIANHIKADGFTFYIFSGILYLIIGFGLFGTVMMMTVERKFEFGMLLAIGMKKSQLKLILLSETILIALCGVLLGIILSFPMVYYLQENPIQLSGDLAKSYEQFGFEAIFPTEINTTIFITQSLIVMIMTIIIGLYPLWFVNGLNPVKAMKK